MRLLPVARLLIIELFLLPEETVGRLTPLYVWRSPPTSTPTTSFQPSARPSLAPPNQRSSQTKRNASPSPSKAGKSSEDGSLIKRPPPPHHNSSEETVTNFLETEDNGDDRGFFGFLSTQNIIVAAAGLFAILATIVGVSIKRKRAANAELDEDDIGANAETTDKNSTILDSVEITQVESVARETRPPPTTNNAVALAPGHDYSCDLFGFSDRMDLSTFLSDFRHCLA